MHESDARGPPVVTATGGVTLQKRLETARFAQPTVLYVLESQRAVPVDVRVVEPVPSALEPTDLGFVGSGDEPPWEFNGPKLVLEHRLDPGSAYRTGIAARGDRAGAITDLLETPEFLDVEAAGTERRVEGDGGSAEADPLDAGPDGSGPLADRLVAELEERLPDPDVDRRLEAVESDVAEVSEFTTSLKAAFRE
jgi:hypothetical protein